MNNTHATFFISTVVLVFCTLTSQLEAGEKLGVPFGDGMVLQCGMKVPIWGNSVPNQKITVHFLGQSKSVKSDEEGNWVVILDPLQENNNPSKLIVEGQGITVFEDVLVGDVWLCAGQSNMQASLERLKASKYSSFNEKLAVEDRVNRGLNSTDENIRMLQKDGGKGIWRHCGPDALKNCENGKQGFSAVGFYFGKRLHAELNRPIGLIQTTKGGSRIEEWTPPQAYQGNPAFSNAVEPDLVDGIRPGRQFKTFIQPLAPFAIRGIIWYQGESNCISKDLGSRYAHKMEILISSWRDVWSRKDLPFYYVQLPPMRYSKRKSPPVLTPEALPQFREGQDMVLKVPFTGMIITTDLADSLDLHPPNKWDIGERLAQLALSSTYGLAGKVCIGPTFKSFLIDKDKVTVRFDLHGSLKLVKDGTSIKGFSIAAADRIFIEAEAEIVNDAVIVSSKRIQNPVAVRFGWHEESRPNLFNAEKLPVAPFRTDAWDIKFITE